MESMIFENTFELKRNLKDIQKKLKVKIMINGKKVSLKGSPLDEYEAEKVLDAMNFGFSAKRALMLLDPDIQFRKISIKNFTTRKNLRDVRARIIGREGKTKRTIEDLTDSLIIIKNNSIGIIGYAESMDNMLTALRNLIRGSKESNVYRFLEEMNAFSKKLKGIERLEKKK